MTSSEAAIAMMIARHLCVPPAEVTFDARLIDDLGADSLDLIELEMAFEDELGVFFGDGSLAKCHTVADVITTVMQRQEAGA